MVSAGPDGLPLGPGGEILLPPGFSLIISNVPWLAGVSLEPILMRCTPRVCDCSWMLLEMTVHGGSGPLLSCCDLILTSYI